MREGIVLKGVPEAAFRRQTLWEARGVPMHHLREGILLEELADDPYIHLPQVKAGGDRANRAVFLVTTRTELARPAAVLI